VSFSLANIYASSSMKKKKKCKQTLPKSFLILQQELGVIKPRVWGAVHAGTMTSNSVAFINNHSQGAVAH